MSPSGLGRVPPARRGELGHLAHQSSEINLLGRVVRLGPRERQQLAHRLAAVHRCISNDWQRFVQRLGIDGRSAHGSLGNVAVAGDQRQRLIEVVGDAAGHLPQCAQFLRLRQHLALLLGIFALGNVHLSSDQAHCPASRIAEHARIAGEPAHHPIGPHHAVFHVEVVAVLERLRDGAFDCLPILGVHAFLEQTWPAIQGAGLLAEQGVGRTRPDAGRRSDVPVPGAQSCRVQRQFQSLLTHPHGRFVPLAREELLLGCQARAAHAYSVGERGIQSGAIFIEPPVEQARHPTSDV